MAKQVVKDVLTIRCADEIAENMRKVSEAAEKAHRWIAEQSGDPLEFLKSVKFEKKGYHPVTHHSLNLIEQVNQTWTFLVALCAVKRLLERHPDADGFTLAPGASASQELDIMSIRPGFVGAETFAATSPGSNGKLKKDLAKMARRPEIHRYIFACPQERYRENMRHPNHEQTGIEVWSLKVDQFLRS
jgi:hypothetical protein